MVLSLLTAGQLDSLGPTKLIPPLNLTIGSYLGRLWILAGNGNLTKLSCLGGLGGGVWIFVFVFGVWKDKSDGGKVACECGSDECGYGVGLWLQVEGGSRSPNIV